MTKKKLKYGGFFLATLIFAISVAPYIFKPNMSRYEDRSTQILSQQGELLRGFLSEDEKWRFKAEYNDIPEYYWDMLIAFEDKRFYSHYGVDILAILRAAHLNIKNKEVLSGASTLTMQVVRLLEPRPRTLKSKAIEAVRAYQLERLYSKKEILSIYATLAPMGGNKEGIETAARFYFNKSPSALTKGEAAWIVALPKNPNFYQGQKNIEQAYKARNKVLKKAYERQVLSEQEYKKALNEKLNIAHYKLPFLAPHYTRMQYYSTPKPVDIISTSLSKELQEQGENILANHLMQLSAHSNLAAAIWDNQSNEPVMWIGASDFFNESRLGHNDMLKAVRSPGSLLKPFIYLYAFDWYNYQPHTVIHDVSTVIGDYQAANYDKKYRGQITLSQALRLSLNVPAVKLLHKITPEAYAEQLKKAGLSIYLPKNTPYRLPIALGGMGVTGEDMLRLYQKLSLCSYGGKSDLARFESCWHVRRILQLAGDSDGRIFWGEEPVAIKTGTSYGWRDRWAVGFTSRYTVIVWAGQPKGEYADARSSVELTAPILRELFALLPNPPKRWSDVKPPHILEIEGGSQLPLSIQSFDKIQLNQLRLIYPQKNEIYEAQYNEKGQIIPLMLKAQGGSLPLTWIVNGEIIHKGLSREINYQPQGEGFYDIQVIDNDGRMQKSFIQIKQKKAAVTPKAKFEIVE